MQLLHYIPTPRDLDVQTFAGVFVKVPALFATVVPVFVDSGWAVRDCGLRACGMLRSRL